MARQAVIDQATEGRLLRLLNYIRTEATDDTIGKLAVAFGTSVTGQNMATVRTEMRVQVSNFVTTGRPSEAKARMDQIAIQARPATNKDF